MSSPSDGTDCGASQIEAATQDSEARYRTLFERAPIGILYADAESYYLDANACMCEMLGYTREELIGKHASDIIAPSEMEHVPGVLVEVRGDADHHREWDFRRKDGTIFPVDVYATKFTDGTLLGMVRDITQLKEHEKEIERMSRLYAALSQVNQAIVWSPTRDELFRKVCRVLVEDGGLRMAWIGWHDPETHRLMPVAEFGDKFGDLQGVEVYADDRPEGRGPSGTTFRSGRPYICNDLLNDPATLPWRPIMVRCGYYACAAFPIRALGEICGTLQIYASRKDFFHDKEVALLEEAAVDISFALDNFARDEARREAERLLRNEKLFSDTMLDSMPGILYFYDSEGRFLRWNKNFETVSGYSGEEIARMHPDEFFPESERARLQQRIAEVFLTGESSVEAEFLSKDGRTTPHFFTGRRIEFQGKTCLVGVGIDISDRKKAEAQLRENEARLLEAQRIARLGSWEWNLQTRQLTWSDQTCEIFGVDRSVNATSYEDFTSLVHPEDRDTLDAALHRTASGGARLDIEYRIVLRGGGEKVVHALADLKRDEQGYSLSLSGTVHDITDRVRIEAERERRHQAEAADRIKSAFLATMSHELRTPLNSIIGFTGIVLQGLAGPLNEEQGKQLGMVRASARHLLALVNDVLDISKIEAGQLDVARELFDVSQSIEKVIAIVTPQAESKRLSMRVALPADLGNAVSDARRFEQIILNLMSNAIKFTDQGEVAVSAERIDYVDMAGESEAQPAVRVRITDTGIGMKAEDLPSLFQPFRQIDSGLSRVHEGTGLGLAICQRLAALMGGEIGAESEWGIGSTFTVTLPLKGRDGS